MASKSITKSILVIDDEPEVLSSIQEILSQIKDWRVTSAGGATEAYLASKNNKYDLVLVDYRMPDTDGFNLISVMRGHKHNKQCPVIIVSGYPDEVIPLIDKTPGVAVLAKPFTANQIVDICDRMLAHASPAMNGPRLKFKNEWLEGLRILSVTIAGAVLQNLEAEALPDFSYDFQKPLNIECGMFASFRIPGIKGFMFVAFPEKSYLALVSRMTGFRHVKITPDSLSPVTEMTELLYTEAGRMFSHQGGYDFLGVKPSFVKDAAALLPRLSGFSTQVFPFRSAHSEFSIMVGLAPDTVPGA